MSWFKLRGTGNDDRAIGRCIAFSSPVGSRLSAGQRIDGCAAATMRPLSTQRRYSLDELREKIERRRLHGLCAQPMQTTLVFPLVAVRRLVLKRIGLADSGRTSSLYPQGRVAEPDSDQCSAVARHVTTRHPKARLPAGLSAICIARKPKWVLSIGVQLQLARWCLHVRAGL